MRQRKMDTFALYQFTNIPEFFEIDSRKTQFIRVDKNERFPNTLMSKFRGPRITNNTSIWKANPFHKWEKEDRRKIFKQYTGPRFAMFNLTANCSRLIHDPIDGTILDSCLKPGDGIQAMTQQAWKSVSLAPAEEEFFKRPVVIQSQHFNFIYCPFNNITVENETEQCPESPFSLPIQVPFETPEISSRMEDVRLVAGDLSNDSPIKHQLIPFRPDNDYFSSLSSIARMKSETKLLEEANMSIMAKPVGKGISGGTLILIIICIYILISRLRQDPSTQAIQTQAAHSISRSYSQMSVASTTPNGPIILTINNSCPSAPNRSPNSSASNIYPKISPTSTSSHTSEENISIKSSKRVSKEIRTPTPYLKLRSISNWSLGRTSAESLTRSAEAINRSLESLKWTFDSEQTESPDKLTDLSDEEDKNLKKQVLPIPKTPQSILRKPIPPKNLRISDQGRMLKG